ncbi:uracil phosphoribosyltransferase [Streptococcus agalactiae]|uniref:uracil phosphoribosyltransferase n=1 Tax=Streptococcus agalactiae TaxID=1311 RepID=UPI00210C4FC6|nr:uracil phosphoribosyltransferase [Streptococcus agalactiae]MCQ3826259.1 uracil phosphoribosyltransferase [Streptococcus agalactiae]
MGKFQVISHPLIQHKLSILRRTTTSTKDFRELVDEIAMLMGYEVSRDLPLEDVEIQTPVATTVQKQLAGKKLAIVPILRAGIGMVDGFLSLVPAAKVGHIGMYRDEETFQPVEYLVKLPEDIDQRQIFVVDPMLATGGSAILAVDSLKERGAASIKFVCLVAAPEGVAALQEAHPDVDIYTAALDEKLNEHGYIVPGLGDAGDRLFGTK